MKNIAGTIKLWHCTYCNRNGNIGTLQNISLSLNALNISQVIIWQISIIDKSNISILTACSENVRSYTLQPNVAICSSNFQLSDSPNEYTKHRPCLASLYNLSMQTYLTPSVEPCKESQLSLYKPSSFPTSQIAWNGFKRIWQKKKHKLERLVCLPVGHPGIALALD